MQRSDELDLLIRGAFERERRARPSPRVWRAIRARLRRGARSREPRAQGLPPVGIVDLRLRAAHVLRIQISLV